MIDMFLSLIALSFTVERTTEWIFDIPFMNKIKKSISFIHIKTIFSLLVSFLITFSANLDLVTMLFSSASGSITGKIVTAVVIAGGSNIINDIISSIQNIKKKTLEGEH